MSFLPGTNNQKINEFIHFSKSGKDSIGSRASSRRLDNCTKISFSSQPSSGFAARSISLLHGLPFCSFLSVWSKNLLCFDVIWLHGTKDHSTARKAMFSQCFCHFFVIPITWKVSCSCTCCFRLMLLLWLVSLVAFAVAGIQPGVVSWISFPVNPAEPDGLQRDLWS